MELAATDRKIVDFLRLKLVEKERTIFELQKDLLVKDEKLHEMERLLREAQRPSTSGDFKLWKSTSQIIVKSLLERITVVTGAYENLLSLNRRCFLEMPRPARNNIPVLPTDTDRLLASTLIESARYRHEMNELRARNESLSQQLSLVTHPSLQQQALSSSDTAHLRRAEATIQHMASLQRKLIQEKDSLSLEVESLRRHSQSHSAHLHGDNPSSTSIPFRLPTNKYAFGL
ncbi:Hypothetical protein, putative [Bodo saltans]|uniref:Uncharacterized protein n=1 Tax=Bodo saltans TaxID=75058 RepID=A0A0S4JI36_BODSA|nr:Hypothetical protein, putative [Bodo saltans]|eukprot:CUG89955.1 Hypothetical protein, putative [Bodo saltans]